MMTFITQGGEGRGKTNRKRKATKSEGRGLEEGASQIYIVFGIHKLLLSVTRGYGESEG